ncbi:MAG: NAD-dependent epimerase/dehydratase family protein [Thermodesulfobacteriota bacterium]
MPKLITGGAGFIGSHLTKRLVDEGEEVVLFDIFLESRLIQPIRNRVRIFKGDLSSWNDIFEVVQKYHIKGIYHLGALLAVEAEENPVKAYRVNVNGTFYILEVARFFKLERVVYISSIASYGTGIPERVNEDVIQMPTSMYGVTKVISERLGEYYHRRFGVDFRALRFPAVIGAGRGGGGATAYSTLIVSEPALGRPYQVPVHEEAQIPLLYIKDAIQSLYSLYKADNEKLKRRVYNIAGFSPTAKQLADAVKKQLPKANLEFKPDPKLVSIIQDWPKYFDETRANQEWGWKTQYNLDEAITDFIQEIQSNPYLYD